MPKSGKIEDEAPKSPHELAMQSITDDVRKQRKVELSEALVAPEDLGEDHVADVVLDLDRNEDVDNLGSIDDNQVIERDGEQFLELTVNGETSEITLAEAVKKLQKGENADLQTKLAVEERQRLETANAVLAAERNRKSTQPDDTEKRRAERKEQVSKALKKLYDDGEVDEATDILAELLNEPQQQVVAPSQAIDESTVLDIVAKRENQKSLGDAFKTFTGDERFKEIAKDDDFITLVDLHTMQLQEDKQFMADSPSYLDIFTKAGEEVLEKMGGAAAQPEKVTDIDSIRDKKRSMPKTVASRTSRRQAPEPKQPKTNSSIISGIAASRGQNTV